MTDGSTNITTCGAVWPQLIIAAMFLIKYRRWKIYQTNYFHEMNIFSFITPTETSLKKDCEIPEVYKKIVYVFCIDGKTFSRILRQIRCDNCYRCGGVGLTQLRTSDIAATSNEPLSRITRSSRLPAASPVQQELFRIFDSTSHFTCGSAQ